MSVELSYSQPNDLEQLTDELTAAGLPPDGVEGLGDDFTLVMPDGTVAAAVDAVVAAHVPMERYDPAAKAAQLARTREAARLRADYERLLVLYRAVAAATQSVNPTMAALLEEATVATIEVLKRRDRAAGIWF